MFYNKNTSKYKIIEKLIFRFMTDSNSVTIRKPTTTDGTNVHHLIQAIPELDSNSIYCNLLQCSHFADTSIIATQGDEVVGFISGYQVPGHPNTLFVWQVAVSAEARGLGLAGRMLKQLLGREEHRAIQFVETTITEPNTASWALFESIARHYNTKLERSVIFDRQDHFRDQHDSELLARIGPFAH